MRTVGHVVIRSAEAGTMQQTNETQTESTEERYRKAAEAAAPPRPKSARPIVILGAGGIVRAAHLPAYAKADFPVIPSADSAGEKPAKLAWERATPPAFNSIEEAVRFAPADAIF